LEQSDCPGADGEQCGGSDRTIPSGIPARYKHDRQAQQDRRTSFY
jgi:hypothetical protein